MPTCLHCGTAFPNRVVVDNRVRVLQRRRYCLECSPFGAHNTRRLHLSSSRARVGPCATCGRSGPKTHSTCASCTQAKRRRRLRTRVLQLVGNVCWVCGYGGTDGHWPVLDFHHVKAETKAFPVSITATTTYAWQQVVLEMRKCVLLCCRCHREHHAGIGRSLEELEYLRQEKWKRIDGGRSSSGRTPDCESGG